MRGDKALGYKFNSQAKQQQPYLQNPEEEACVGIIKSMASQQGLYCLVGYYLRRASLGLLKFTSGLVSYPRRSWFMFSRLFKCMLPLFKKAFIIAKPHLKSAARNIAVDIIRAALSDDQQQEGTATTLEDSARETV